MLRERIKRLLETYSLEEILEYNDLEEEDIILFLYESGFIELPEEPLG